MRNNNSFQSLFAIAANRFGVGKQLTAIRICNYARKILANHFPVASTSQIQVISCKAGTLQLASSSPTWAHQLTMRKHQIISEINQQLGTDAVKKIKLVSRSPQVDQYMPEQM